MTNLEEFEAWLIKNWGFSLVPQAILDRVAELVEKEREEAYRDGWTDGTAPQW